MRRKADLTAESMIIAGGCMNLISSEFIPRAASASARFPSLKEVIPSGAGFHAQREESNGDLPNHRPHAGALQVPGAPLLPGFGRSGDFVWCQSENRPHHSSPRLA